MVENLCRRWGYEKGALLEQYERELTRSGNRVADIVIQGFFKPALMPLIEEIQRIPPLV